MNTPSAHDARTLLDRAETTSRQAAGFSFAWLCYLALCAGGAITSVGLAYANVTDAAVLPPGWPADCGSSSASSPSQPPPPPHRPAAASVPAGPS